MVIADKFDMSQEENIFCAKRVLVDSIYKQANLEGIAVTYAQTEDILNNVNVNSITPNEINKVCCLKDTWQYVLDNVNVPVDLVFIETVHELVARFDVDYKYLGKFRVEDVMISGTDWRPELPDAESVLQSLKEVQESEYVTDRALKTGLVLMRMQPFKDGNKRVGSFAINKILIENGKGLFNVPVKLDGQFKQLLVEYYETGNWDNILLFMQENCLQGVNPITLADNN